MGSFIETVIEELFGKKCRVETTDGSVRVEVIMSAEWKSIKVGGGSARYPVALFFDKGEIDGVELRIVKSIEVV